MLSPCSRSMPRCWSQRLCWRWALLLSDRLAVLPEPVPRRVRHRGRRRGRRPHRHGPPSVSSGRCTAAASGRDSGVDAGPRAWHAAAGFATNNFGFATPHDFPYLKKSEQEFVVGVFGGSVGVWFCQLGMPRVVQELSQRPFFRDRTIVPLCFSHEGYKQPQQAVLLTYFSCRSASSSTW